MNIFCFLSFQITSYAFFRRVRVSSSCEENDPDQKDEIRKEKPPRNVNHPKVKRMYTGHRNARTMVIILIIRLNLLLRVHINHADKFEG